MLKRFFTFFLATIFISMLFVAVTSAFNPKFKEQDLDKATEECVDGSPCKPELVATEDDDGNFNFALLEDAEPNADSLIAGWCPDRHCTEYLNDGFYNNCRSWITGSGGPEAWCEVDMGDVYRVKKVGIGSDHCGNYKDRFAKDFKILVATQYKEDSKATSWKVAYDNDNGDAVHETVYFEFKEVEARYVRIFVETGGGGVRIDELEIWGGPQAVTSQNKIASYWGQIKTQY